MCHAAFHSLSIVVREPCYNSPFCNMCSQLVDRTAFILHLQSHPAMYLIRERLARCAFCSPCVPYRTAQVIEPVGVDRGSVLSREGVPRSPSVGRCGRVVLGDANGYPYCPSLLGRPSPRPRSAEHHPHPKIFYIFNTALSRRPRQRGACPQLVTPYGGRLLFAIRE